MALTELQTQAVVVAALHSKLRQQQETAAQAVQVS
jgi:hypothetical protein